jgi:hypothetical protein
LQNEIISQSDDIVGPLPQGSNFTIFLGLNNRRRSKKHDQRHQINADLHDMPLSWMDPRGWNKKTVPAGPSPNTHARREHNQE